MVVLGQRGGGVDTGKQTHPSKNVDGLGQGSYECEGFRPRLKPTRKEEKGGEEWRLS